MEMFGKPKEYREYFTQFKKNIDELRTKKELFDINLKVKLKDGSERDYLAHKFVLACASIFFKEQILQLERAKSEGVSNTDTLELKPTCELDYFSFILNYVYTGEIQCSVENIIGLYEYSEDFQLSSLKSLVIKFMRENLKVNTWLDFWRFARKKKIAALIEHCETFYVENLKTILEVYLKKLELNELSKIVRNPKINLEKTYLIVFKYVIRWVQIDEKERIDELFGLTNKNKYLKWEAILCLCENYSHKLKDYVKDFTFKNLCDLYIENKTENCKKNLFACFTNWTYVDRDDRKENFFDLLKLIDFPNMELEFVKRQILCEKLIYDDPIIKQWLENVLNSNRIKSTVECNISNQEVYLVSQNTVYNVDQRMKSLKEIFPYKIKLDFGFAAIPTIDNKNILILSGQNFYTISMQNNSFKQLAPMNELRSLHNMIQFNNKIYSCGGSLGAYANTKTVEEYDMERNEWVDSVSMNEGRYSYKMEKHNNSILVVGGKGETFRLGKKGEMLTVPPPMERFDPREGKWQKIEDSQFPNSCQNYFSFLCEDSIYYYEIKRESRQKYGNRFDLKMNRWLNANLDFPDGLNMLETKYVYSCCTKPIYVAAVNKSNFAEVFEFQLETERWSKDEEFSISDFPEFYTSNLIGFIN